MNDLENRVVQLEKLLNFFIKADRYRFPRDIELVDAINFRFNGITGTKIGTDTSQKLSFYGVTPIVQPTAVTAPSGGTVIDTQARTAINSLITQFHNLGLNS